MPSSALSFLMQRAPAIRLEQNEGHPTIYFLRSVASRSKDIAAPAVGREQSASRLPTARLGTLGSVRGRGHGARVMKLRAMMALFAPYRLAKRLG